MQTYLVGMTKPRTAIDKVVQANIKKLLALALWKSGKSFTDSIALDESLQPTSIKGLLEEARTIFEKLGIVHGVAVCLYLSAVVRINKKQETVNE